jgi:hypothetical protein
MGRCTAETGENLVHPQRGIAQATNVSGWDLPHLLLLVRFVSSTCAERADETQNQLIASFCFSVWISSMPQVHPLCPLIFGVGAPQAMCLQAHVLICKQRCWGASLLLLDASWAAVFSLLGD